MLQLFLYRITAPMTKEDVVIDNEQAVIETPEVEDSQHEESEETELMDKKRHKELLHGKEQELAQARNQTAQIAFEVVENDIMKLLDYHAKDPKLAKRVAERFDWWTSEYWTYENFLKGNKNGVDDFDSKYEKRRAQEVHEESLKKAQKILDKVPENLQEEAKAYFDEITEGKTLTEDKALKFAEMATLYVNKDKISKDKKTQAIKELSSSWVPSTTGGSSDPDELIVNGFKRENGKWVKI
mgnify:CR=1 FL=1